MLRRLVHLLAGMVFPLAALFVSKGILLIALGTVVAAFLVLDLVRFTFPGVNRLFIHQLRGVVREEEHSRLTGSTYLFLSSLVAFLAFPRDVAVLAVSFLAVGDVAGGVAGSRLRRVKVFGKSLEGDMACFIACLATGAFLSLAALNVPFSIVVAGSASAALIQALPLPVDDNVTIPLFSGAVMALMQNL